MTGVALWLGALVIIHAGTVDHFEEFRVNTFAGIRVHSVDTLGVNIVSAWIIGTIVNIHTNILSVFFVTSVTNA